MIGTTAFAVSGALAASRKNMDIFGFCVLALMPAIGGGTLRDIILDRNPVFWIENPVYVTVALLSAVVVFFGAYAPGSRLRLLIWTDALGMALFAAMGTGISIDMGTGSLVAVMMGVTTAIAGGMIRDIICNQLPLVLGKEVYATAAFVTGITYVLAIEAGAADRYALIIATVVGFAVRGLAIIYDWKLPPPRVRSGN